MVLFVFVVGDVMMVLIGVTGGAMVVSAFVNDAVTLCDM
jgi:hypothetical protein